MAAISGYKELPKPIFIFGVPRSVGSEDVNMISSALSERLDDYHVIVLQNSTDDFTAKLYSVHSDEPVNLDVIKDYIKSKF